MQNLPLTAKAVEWAAHFRMRARTWVNPDVSGVFTDIEFYRELLLLHGGIALEDATVFELGYGARPLRLIALSSFSRDVWGIDLDYPVIGPDVSALSKTLRHNGWERALKSAVRSVLFDPWEQRAIRKCLRDQARSRGRSVRRLERSHCLVGDICDELPSVLPLQGKIDLVVSEDVLEHIPAPGLPTAIKNISTLLTPNGLALLRPMVFTGILGGHLVEWYSVSSSIERRSEPWEHLRKKRFHANTFLNELQRKEYRSLLSEEFIILDEIEAEPGLGREFLADDLLAELKEYPIEELLSNRVMFVCKKKPGVDP